MHQADVVMPTASLIKFPVMVAAYRMADEKKLDLQRMVTLRDEDKVPGSGILTNHFSAGMQISIRDALRLMIAYSDNTATNLVLDQIGLHATSDTMQQLGLSDTKLHAKVFRADTSIFPERSKQYGLGSTTPRQMVKLLELLQQDQAASPESCEWMRGHLLACEDKNKLPRDLPAGVKVAHKTGSVNAVRTDAGIILSPSGPIAICVMTAENSDRRWSPENAAEILIGRIARAVYDHFHPVPAASDSIAPLPLTSGAAGQLVESLQRTLNARLSPSPELTVDGDFGALTRAAVVRFQQMNNLAATGTVGPETWKALGTLLAEGAQVPDPAVVNAERQPRELPENLAAPPLTTAKAWAIAEARTGVLLWGYNERERLHFASTTKMMTAYLVLSLAERDATVLDEVVTFSQRADDTGGSTAAIRAGEQLPVRELLYGLMLPSGNDASVALGEHFGQRLQTTTKGGDAADSGTPTDPLEAFVSHMNLTAQSLGMRDTHYRNPHGLTHAEHQSSAADLVTLAHAARKLRPFRDYVATRQRGYSVSSTAGYSRNVLWRNTNKLLAIAGYSGVKTGTTDAAGACLVSCGELQGDELLVVVLGSATSDGRYIDARNLFRWAWGQRR
jgi:D-alanyl-D-alanine carboxypeptidase (penicillin-binding protein 5/6)